MPVAIAQGTTLSWGGTSFSLIAFSWDGTSTAIDMTSMESQITTTIDERKVVVKDVDCGSIDWGKLSIQFWGASNIGCAEQGSIEQLTFSIPSSASLSGYALLESISFQGSVGDLIKGSAVFQFSGIY